MPDAAESQCDVARSECAKGKVIITRIDGGLSAGSPNPVITTQYFYTPNSTDLAGIFQHIALEIKLRLVQ